jgi:hypothetical protein
MKNNLLAGVAAAAVSLAASSVAIAADAPGGRQPTTQELLERIERLEGELQHAQRQGAKTSNDVEEIKSAKPKTGWWENTSVSGRMYFDATHIDHKSNGAKTGLVDNGYGFDIKRFYIGIDHKFNDIFSANVTTDFTYAGKSTETNTTRLYLKKAFLQAKVDDALVLRLGSTDLPWVPFVEDVYGYRHVENTLIDRTSFGTSADWGAHASGKLAGGVLNYAVAVVNGAGYKNPPGAGNAKHFQSVDFEGRVNANWQNFIVGVGGYVGKLGNDVQGARTFHTASRFDALAAYVAGPMRVGVEYFTANNWKNVNSATADKAEGIGGFVSYKFLPEWSVFGRYDYVKPNKDTNSSLHENYYNVGIQWSPAKIVDFALAYKHDRAEHGTIGTSNGTIGGSRNGTYSEIGIWGQFRW